MSPRASPLQKTGGKHYNPFLTLFPCLGRDQIRFPFRIQAHHFYSRLKGFPTG